MENAPWKIIFIAQEQHVFTKIISMVGVVFFVLLVALTVMLLSTKKITFHEFIYPAESLVRHISKESENDPSGIPHNVPKPWVPWFTEISKIFTENRNLIEEIKEKNEKLTEINLSLERYMPKFILLINVKNGYGGTTIGNCFADAFVKLDVEKTTVYMEYPVP